MMQSSYATLVSRLRRLSRLVLAVRMAGGVCRAMTFAILLAGMLAFAESFAYFTPPVKTVLAAMICVVPLAVLLHAIVMAVVHRPDVDDAARLVEHAFPSLGDRLISAIQLGRIASDRLGGQSPGLIAALVTSAGHETASLDLRRAVPTGGLVQSGRLALVAVLLFAGFTVAFPERVVGGLYRLADFRRSYAPLDTTRIFTAQHPDRIIEGDSFNVSGFVSGASAGEVTILYRMGASREWNVKPVTPGGRDGEFTATVEKPRATFAYYLEAPGAATVVRTVGVIERPAVASLNITLSYPGYTGLGEVIRVDGDGNIRAIAGTGVTMTVHATKPLASMRLVRADSSSVACAVTGDAGTVAFDITENVDYHFELADTLGIANADPVVYRITTLADEYPSVSILSPGADVVLPGSMRLPLVYRAGDDYGLSAVELIFTLPHEETPRTVMLAENAGTAITAEYLWDLSGMNLLPDDTISYTLLTYDTDTVNGPKRTGTDTRFVRLPSLIDILTEAMDARDEDIDRLRELTDRADKQQERLDEVNRSIRSERDLEWSDRNALDEARRDLEQMREETADVAEHIEQMAARLSDEEVVAAETLMQMEKIAGIMNDIAEGDMKRALEQLTQVSMQVDPQTVKQLLDEYQVTAGDIREKLDRIISLLEQARTLQRFEMARNLLEEMAVRQADLDARHESDPDNPSLAREESALAGEMEDIRESLAAALDSLDAQFGMNTSEARQSLERNDATGPMHDAARMMEEGDSPEADTALDEANRRIGELLAAMDTLGNQMANANSAEMKHRLFTALNQLVAVSEKQEALVGDIPGADTETLARDQLGIIDGLDRADESLSRLGEMVAELAPLTGQVTAAPRMLMESAVQGFTTGNRAAGESQASSSLRTLNQSISILTSLLENSGSGSSGQGMPGDLMQQLQSIANGQLGLQRQLSGEQMGQLAAEQAKLSEMLSDLARKVLEDDRLRGMLDQLAREMDETSDMMRRTESREVVERRQLDIYRRLLDARRSRREKNEAEERRSWTARENVSFGADALPADLGERELELNRRLEEALDGDFDPAYKELIRDYFESLLGDREEVAR